MRLAEKEKRTKKCRIARNRYQHIISARRIYGIDPDGNQADYTDKERAKATASAKADIKTWCDQ